METTVGAKIYIKNPSKELLAYVEKELIFPNPQYEKNKALGYSVYKVPKMIQLYQNLGDTIILPFGCLKDIWKFIKCSPVNNDFKAIETQKKVCLLNLRDYQKNALETLKNAKGGILVSPCGSGKTLIGLNLANELHQKTLWVAHTKDLVNQAKESYEKHFGVINENDVGTIIEGQVNVGTVITFATVQTLSHLDLQDFKHTWNTIIIDECVHCVSTPNKLTMFDKVVGSLCARYKYGLTATPKRIDGLTNTMYKLLGNKAHTITDQEVNSIKVKADLEIIECPTTESLYYYTSDHKFINYKFSEFISKHPQRNAIITNNIVKRFEDSKRHKQLVLCERIEQTELLAEKLEFYNDSVEDKIKYVVFNGNTRKKVRDDVLLNYEKYDVIIATYQIASEGLDMPKLDILHLASPKTKNNRSLLKQCVGRVERSAPDKTSATVYWYRDFNILYCLRATDNVRLAMGINKRDFVFKKGEN